MPMPEQDFPEPLQLRVPPYSAEAEQSVIGALLQDDQCFSLVSADLTAAHFYSSAHRAIYAAICSLLKDGQPADVISVFERLQSQGQDEDAGGLAYVNQLSACVASSSNIKRYAEIVIDRSVSRALIASLDEAARIAWDASVPLGDRLSKASELVRRADLAHKHPAAGRIALLGLDGLCAASAAVTWLCKRIIPADSLGLLFGGSGTFKSFIALDLALHTCRGLPWMGRKTRKGPVLYIAAEGGAGLWNRIYAWHKVRGMDWRESPLYVVPVAVDLGADAWRVVDAAQLAGVTPELVIVDTLSQTFSGEENSAAEIAGYLREIGARFRALWHCAVLVIHHSGHNATERPRGSSAIRANVDFMLGVFRDEKEMLATLTCAKQKDGESFEDATFSLFPVGVAEDEDGDRITSLVARHLSSADEVDQAIETEGKAGRGGKNQLLLSLLSSGMREAELRKAFYEDCDLQSTEARRQAYHRAKAWALKAGFFEVAQGIVIVTKARGAA